MAESLTLSDKLDRVSPRGEIVHPWHQLPHESDLAYHRFKLYRDTPPYQRSIKGIADHPESGECSPQSLYMISRKNRWQTRVRAYDAYLDQQKVEVEVTEVAAMHRRHVQLGRTMQDLGEAALLDFLTKYERGEDVVIRLRDAVRLTEVGTRLEAASVSTSGIGDGDLSCLDDQELAAYLRLRTKVRQHAERGGH